MDLVCNARKGDEKTGLVLTAPMAGGAVLNC
jgi:hypothetical protein